MRPAIFIFFGFILMSSCFCKANEEALDTSTTNKARKKIEKPKTQLERIIRKPVLYFAYPFGVWNTTAIDSLKANGYQLAFILSGKKDKIDSLFTIRRMIVAGSYSTKAFLKGMQHTFK